MKTLLILCFAVLGFAGFANAETVVVERHHHTYHHRHVVHHYHHHTSHRAVMVHEG